MAARDHESVIEMEQHRKALPMLRPVEYFAMTGAAAASVHASRRPLTAIQESIVTS
jgi:hypothetical protein